MLIQLEERLENVRDAPDLPKVIRIAAIASLLVVKSIQNFLTYQKYIALLWVCILFLLGITSLISCHSDVSR